MVKQVTGGPTGRYESLDCNYKQRQVETTISPPPKNMLKKRNILGLTRKGIAV